MATNGVVPASTNGHHTNGNDRMSPVSKKLKIGPKEELAEFDKAFPILLRECLNEGNVDKDKQIGDAISHFLKVCKYDFLIFFSTVTVNDELFKDTICNGLSFE